MKLFVAVAALMGLKALAFPTVMEELGKRQGLPSTAVAQAISRARDNCGTTPCLVFDGPSALVSTTGTHKYIAPGEGDVRGPCPGLNAAANHGYLSRSGFTTIPETIFGLNQAYGMGPDLAGVLAAYAIVIDGDPVTEQWSIGGKLPANLLNQVGILGQGEGITCSHNRYEGDSSMTRADAYTNNGDAHSLILSRFTKAYAIAVEDGTDRYTLDKLLRLYVNNTQESVETNEYYFAPPFSTTAVTPAAYNFIINFMSNHSAAEPGGYLNGDILKTFFAIEGDYPNFTWNRGQERIPDNWYRRTLTNQYMNADVFEDLAVGWLAYPEGFRLGGNTNGVNTYEGIDLSDLTGGVIDTDYLFNLNGQGACFFAEAIQEAVPDFASLPVSQQANVEALVNKYFKTLASGFDCPTFSLDPSYYNDYPGSKYNGQTNCADLTYRLM